MASQLNLFENPKDELSAATPAHSSLVTGLHYEPEFLTTDEEHALVEHIDRSSWLTDLKRRVQHYGWRYDYKARRIDARMHLGPLPNWLSDLGNKLVMRNWFDRAPDQAIVNEYLPGQGIAPHTDCIPCFGPTLVSVSLLSPVLMDFYNPRTGNSQSLLLAPRSAFVLRGEARSIWRHGIAPRHRDKSGDGFLQRSRRLSITFRTVVLSGTGAARNHS